MSANQDSLDYQRQENDRETNFVDKPAAYAATQQVSSKGSKKHQNRCMENLASENCIEVCCQIAEQDKMEQVGLQPGEVKDFCSQFEEGLQMTSFPA